MAEDFSLPCSSDDGDSDDTSECFPSLSLYSSGYWFTPVVKIPAGEVPSAETTITLQVARLFALSQGWGSRCRLQRLAEELNEAGVTFDSSRPDRKGVSHSSGGSSPASGGRVYLGRKSGDRTLQTSARSLAWSRLCPDFSNLGDQIVQGLNLDGVPSNLTAPAACVSRLMSKNGPQFYLDHLCCQSPGKWDVHIPFTVSNFTEGRKRVKESTFGNLKVIIYASTLPKTPGRPTPKKRNNSRSSRKGTFAVTQDETQIEIAFATADSPQAKTPADLISHFWSVPQVFYQLVWNKSTKDTVQLDWGIWSLSHLNPTNAFNRLSTPESKGKSLNFSIRLISRFMEPITTCLVPGDYSKRRSLPSAAISHSVETDADLDEIAKKVSKWSPFSWSYTNVVNQAISTIDPPNTKLHEIKRRKGRPLPSKCNSGQILIEDLPLTCDQIRHINKQDSSLVPGKSITRQLRTILPFLDLGCMGSASSVWSRLEPVFQGCLSSPCLDIVFSFMRPLNYAPVVRSLREWINQEAAIAGRNKKSVSLTISALKALGYTGRLVEDSKTAKPLDTPTAMGESPFNLVVPESIGLGGVDFPTDIPTLPLLLVVTVKEALRSRLKHPTRRISRKWIFRILRLVAELNCLGTALDILDVPTIIQHLKPTILDSLQLCKALYDKQDQDKRGSLLRTFFYLDKTSVLNSPPPSGLNFLQSELSSQLTFTISPHNDHQSLEEMMRTLRGNDTYDNYLLPNGSFAKVQASSQVGALPVELGVQLINGRGATLEDWTAPDYIDLSFLVDSAPKSKLSVYYLSSVIVQIPRSKEEANGRIVAYLKDPISGTWDMVSDHKSGGFPVPMNRSFIEQVRSVGLKQTRRGKVFELDEYLMRASEDSYSSFLSSPSYWTFNGSFVPLYLSYVRMENIAKMVALTKQTRHVEHELKVLPFFLPALAEASICKLSSEAAGAASQSVLREEYFLLGAFNFQEGIDLGDPESKANFVYQEVVPGQYNWSLAIPTFDRTATRWNEASYPPVFIDARCKATCLEAVDCSEPDEDSDWEVESWGGDDEKAESVDPPSKSGSCVVTREQRWSSHFSKKQPCVLKDDPEDPYAANDDMSMMSRTSSRWLMADAFFEGVEPGDYRPIVIPATMIQQRHSAQKEDTEELNSTIKDVLSEALVAKRMMSPISGDHPALDQTPQVLMESVAKTTYFRAAGLFAHQFEAPIPKNDSGGAMTSRSREARSHHQLAHSHVIHVFILDEAQLFGGSNATALRSVVSGTNREIREAMTCKWKKKSELTDESLNPFALDFEKIDCEDFQTDLAFSNTGHVWTSSVFGSHFSSASQAAAQLLTLPLSVHLACRSSTEVSDLALLLSFLHGETTDETSIYALTVRQNTEKGQGLWNCNFEAMLSHGTVEKWVVRTPSASGSIARLFIMGVKKPGSLLGGNFINLCSTGRQFANLAPTQSLQKALDYMECSEEGRNLMFPLVKCVAEEATVLCFIKQFDPKHLSSIFIGTLIIKHTSYMCDHRDVLAAAMNRATRETLSLRKEVLQTFILSEELDKDDHESTLNLISVIELQIEESSTTVLSSQGSAEIMIFEETQDNILVPLPLNFVTAQQLFNGKSWTTLIVQNVPPGYALCSVCERGLPMEQAAARAFGTCSIQCEVVAQVARDVKAHVPGTYWGRASVPPSISMASKNPQPFVGEYQLTGRSIGDRPVYVCRSRRGMWVLSYDSQMLAWKVQGPEDLTSDCTGIIAISTVAPFSLHPGDIQGQWRVATMSGLEVDPYLVINFDLVKQNVPNEFCTKARSSNILAVFPRAKVDIGGKPMYMKTPHPQSETCFPPTSLRFKPEESRWELVMSASPDMSILDSLATNRLVALSSKPPDNRIKILKSRNLPQSDWITSASKGPESLGFQPVISSELWRPLVLTITSELPGLPSGEYILKDDGLQSTYIFIASPNSLPTTTSLMSVFIRVFDLEGYSLCFGRIINEVITAHVVLGLSEGTREDGIWRPIPATHLKMDKSQIAKAGYCNIQSMVSLPIALHAISQDPTTRDLFEGTYLLVDCLFNLRPLYVRLTSKYVPNGMYTPFVSAPVSAKMVDAFESQEPLLFLYYSSTTETWRVGTSLGAGAAYVETPLNILHHPGVLITRVDDSTIVQSPSRPNDCSKLLKGKWTSQCIQLKKAIDEIRQEWVAGKSTSYRLHSSKTLEFESCDREQNVSLMFAQLSGEITADTAHVQTLTENPLAPIVDDICSSRQTTRSSNHDAWKDLASETSTQGSTTPISKTCDVQRLKARRLKCAVWRRLFNETLFMAKERPSQRLRKAYTRCLLTRVANPAEGEKYRDSLQHRVVNLLRVIPSSGSMIEKALAAMTDGVNDVAPAAKIVHDQPAISDAATVEAIMRNIGANDPKRTGEADSPRSLSKKKNKQKKSPPFLKHGVGDETGELKTHQPEQMLGERLLKIVLEQSESNVSHGQFGVLVSKDNMAASRLRSLRQKSSKLPLTAVVQNCLADWLVSDGTNVTAASWETLVQTVAKRAISYEEETASYLGSSGLSISDLSKGFLSTVAYWELLLTKKGFIDYLDDQVVGLIEANNIILPTKLMGKTNLVQKLFCHEEILVLCILLGSTQTMTAGASKRFAFTLESSPDGNHTYFYDLEDCGADVREPDRMTRPLDLIQSICQRESAEEAVLLAQAQEKAVADLARETAAAEALASQKARARAAREKAVAAQAAARERASAMDREHQLQIENQLLEQAKAESSKRARQVAACDSQRSEAAAGRNGITCKPQEAQLNIPLMSPQLAAIEESLSTPRDLQLPPSQELKSYNKTQTTETFPKPVLTRAPTGRDYVQPAIRTQPKEEVVQNAGFIPPPGFSQRNVRSRESGLAYRSSFAPATLVVETPSHPSFRASVAQKKQEQLQNAREPKTLLTMARPGRCDQFDLVAGPLTPNPFASGDQWIKPGDARQSFFLIQHIWNDNRLDDEREYEESMLPENLLSFD